MVIMSSEKNYMNRIMLFIILIFVTSLTVIGQEDTTDSDLLVDGNAVVAQLNAFDQVVLTAEGQIVNQSETIAYQNVTIFADVYDANDEIIGEGFGFLVNECGTGLLPSFALQPDSSQSYAVTLEIFEEDADIERIELFPEGSATDATENRIPEDLVGITQISDQEVVNVEWIDPTSFRYAVGCHSDVFTNQECSQHSLGNANPFGIQHPRAEEVTQALLAQLGLTDPALYNRSFLTFPLTARRIIYQTDLNVMLSSEPDGSFKRLIYEDLARISLQGFIWLPEGRFLAYYFGAYGEDVLYFTASVEGQRISAFVYDTVRSTIVPGPRQDGARAVIATTIDDVTGYYSVDTAFGGTELLFEGESPSNNYPAPIYATNDAGEVFIYLVRDNEDDAVLQCFDLQTRELNTLAALPLQLTTEDRAWTWLSPDNSRIALAANGVDGGLWLINVQALGGCSPALAG